MICTERDEKGKMKTTKVVACAKEKGKGEKAAGCPPGRELKITNYELQITNLGH